MDFPNFWLKPFRYKFGKWQNQIFFVNLANLDQKLELPEKANLNFLDFCMTTFYSKHYRYSIHYRVKKPGTEICFSCLFK